jgi:hypothetical protein
MGPFRAPLWSPLSFKPTGFITGAGHGSTFQDLQGRWWHIATMTISVRHLFERRLGMFPARFLPDGQMVEDSYLADYPHRWSGDRGLAGWMLLSYSKPVTASSSLEGHEPQKAVDENVRDWWSAKSGGAREWLTVDLESVAAINAIQIDFADEGAAVHGFVAGGYRYLLEASADGKRWRTLVDHSNGGEDAPHDYEELPSAVHARYVRITNKGMPGGAKFSLSGLRIFGNSKGSLPSAASTVLVTRSAATPLDKRIAEVSWSSAHNADFYIVRYGIAADRLFASYQVYGATSVQIRSLIADVPYFFTVDAVNSVGVTFGHGVVALEP